MDADDEKMEIMDDEAEVTKSGLPTPSSCYTKTPLLLWGMSAVLFLFSTVMWGLNVDGRYSQYPSRWVSYTNYSFPETGDIWNATFSLYLEENGLVLLGKDAPSVINTTCHLFWDQRDCPKVFKEPFVFNPCQYSREFIDLGQRFRCNEDWAAASLSSDECASYFIVSTVMLMLSIVGLLQGIQLVIFTVDKGKKKNLPSPTLMRLWRLLSLIGALAFFATACFVCLRFALIVFDSLPEMPLS